MPDFADYCRVPGCRVVRATAKALLVAVPDHGEVWFPQGQIDDRSDVYREGDEGDLWISQWIAEQKGLA